MSTTFSRAIIATWVVSPTAISMGLWLNQGRPILVYVQPTDVGDWVFDARIRLASGQPTMVGVHVLVEITTDVPASVVALWSPDRLRKVDVPQTKSPPGPTAEQVDAAREYINRKRTGVQAPLEFGPVSWCSARVPVEPWTDTDIVAEARRLGWTG